ncbi:hypothetical protein ABK040_001743 [Willaertia magna]
MNQYEVLQVINKNQFICRITEKSVKSSKSLTSSSSFLITKQYLYSFDHSKYHSEDERLFAKYKELHDRIDCLLFLKDKQFIHLFDCFYFEQEDKSSKITDKYFCTVELLDGFVSLRYLLYKNRTQNENKFQPLKQSLIFSVMNTCLKCLKLMHTLGQSCSELTPCNILIERKTKRVYLRPFSIDSLNTLKRNLIGKYLVKYIDPFTCKINSGSFKVLVKEFEESNNWYYPPEILFKLHGFLRKNRECDVDMVLTELFTKQELLSKQKDVWSLGCIFCETFLPYPIFSARKIEDQIVNIISILGVNFNSFDLKTIPLYLKECEYFDLVTIRGSINPIQNIRNYLSVSPGYEILNGVLQTVTCVLDYNSEKRPSVINLLDMPMFSLFSQTSGIHFYKKSDKELINLSPVAVENVIEEYTKHTSNSTGSDFDSLYEESMELAAILNPKPKAKKEEKNTEISNTDKLVVTSKDKSLHNFNTEIDRNVINYLSSSENDNSVRTKTSITRVFSKLEEVYREQLKQMGKDINDVKSALGELRDISEKQNLEIKKELKATLPCPVQRLQISIEKLKNIQTSVGKLFFSVIWGKIEKTTMSKEYELNYALFDIERDLLSNCGWHNELTIQIYDVTENSTELIGEVLIDISQLLKHNKTRINEVSGWYKIFGLRKKKSGGEIFVKVIGYLSKLSKKQSQNNNNKELIESNNNNDTAPHTTSTLLITTTDDVVEQHEENVMHCNPTTIDSNESISSSKYHNNEEDSQTSDDNYILDDVGNIISCLQRLQQELKAFEVPAISKNPLNTNYK